MRCQRTLRSLAIIGATMLAAPAVSRADLPASSASELSQANRLSLFHDYGLDSLGLSTNRDIPGSAGGGVMTSMMGRWASTDPEEAARDYSVMFTPLAGYDSNPAARNAARGAGFVGGDLAGVYRWNIGENDPTVGSPTQIQVAADFTGAIYDGRVSNSDTYQFTASGSYRRSLFANSLVVGIGLQEQFTTELGNPFLNTFDITPGVEWFMIPQVSAELNYDYTSVGFFLHAPRREDPNSDRSTVNVLFHFYPTPQVRGPVPESPDQLGDILRESLHRFTIGYAAVFNETPLNSLDYNYESNRLLLGFEGLHYRKLPDVTMDLMYAHEWQNYMNPSAEAPTVIAGSPHGIRRKDHVDVFTLRTNARLFDLPEERGTLSSFLQWDILADRSNIQVRHFNEFVISGGLVYRY